MRVEEFSLERWLLQEAAIDLAMGGIPRLRLSEVSEIPTDTLLTYGITRGSEELRDLVSALYPGTNAEGVLITSGASEANFLAISTLLEPGDEVVTLNPTYMQMRGLARSLGAHVRVVDLVEDAMWQIDLDRLRARISHRTKVICLVNPNNPDGSLISRAEMESICELASRVDAWVLCDGALRGTELEGPMASSPVGSYARGVATGGLSKLGMPGLRIGWLVADPAFAARCWILKDYVTLSHSGLGESLALAALQGPRFNAFIERAREHIRRNVAVVSNWITNMDPLVSWVPPRAGHTSFPRYRLPIKSVVLCRRLIEEEGVLLAPGAIFNSEEHFRLRHSAELSSLEEGLRRIESFLLRQNGVLAGRPGR